MATATASTHVAGIDAKLRSASSALAGARHTAWRTPSADNLAALERAEQRVDQLLDRRLQVTR